MNRLECGCSWHFAKQQVASKDIGPNNAAASFVLGASSNGRNKEERTLKDVLEEGMVK